MLDLYSVMHLFYDLKDFNDWNVIPSIHVDIKTEPEMAASFYPPIKSFFFFHFFFHKTIYF